MARWASTSSSPRQGCDRRHDDQAGRDADTVLEFLHPGRRHRCGDGAPDSARRQGDQRADGSAGRRLDRPGSRPAGERCSRWSAPRPEPASAPAANAKRSGHLYRISLSTSAVWLSLPRGGMAAQAAMTMAEVGGYRHERDRRRSEGCACRRRATTAKSSFSGRFWILGAIVAAAALLSTSSASTCIRRAPARPSRIPATTPRTSRTVFHDLLNQRLHVMEHGGRNECSATVRRWRPSRTATGPHWSPVSSVLRDLQKRQSVEQLNFWLPPATIYYRAGQPGGSGHRLLQVPSHRRRRQRTPPARAGRRKPASPAGSTCAPSCRVVVDGNFVGSVEFASTLEVPLERASVTAEMKWAVGVTKEISRAGRAAGRSEDRRLAEGRRLLHVLRSGDATDHALDQLRSALHHLLAGDRQAPSHDLRAHLSR